MSARERLIELLKQKSCMFVACDEECDGCGNAEMYESEIESIADHLIANGVIVPPCKVGDTVWFIYNYTQPKKFQISILTMSENHYSFVIETKDRVYKHYCCKDSIGKSVFFTREEAEKALAKRSKE